MEKLCGKGEEGGERGKKEKINLLTILKKKNEESINKRRKYM